jgi:hypothetical protein
MRPDLDDMTTFRLSGSRYKWFIPIVSMFISPNDATKASLNTISSKTRRRNNDTTHREVFII